MRKSVRTVFTLAVGMLILAVSMGCEENNMPDTKKSRLVAVENMQLKEQLKQRDAEIETQKELLAECLEKKKVLEQRSQKDIENVMAVLLSNVSENTQRLQQENESLKAQIEALKKELGRN